MRLQKLLAAAGLASRRGAEKLLREGRVTLNGRLARLGESADAAHDVVALDGEPLARAAREYWVLHKTAGVLSTRSDARGRPTVMELLPAEIRAVVFPVGRLDLDTEGLLLLTNDGDLAHALLHPSHGCEREYEVVVQGRLDAARAGRLAEGIVLDGERTAPARVSRRRFEAGANATRLRLTLREGRKRQIRRATAVLGHPVLSLVRLRMGPIRLGALAPGAVRRLTGAEVRGLLGHAERLRRERRAGEPVSGAPQAAPRDARRHARRGTLRRAARSGPGRPRPTSSSLCESH